MNSDRDIYQKKKKLTEKSRKTKAQNKWQGEKTMNQQRWKKERERQEREKKKWKKIMEDCMYNSMKINLKT